LSLILLDDFQPANRREETPVAALLLQLSDGYPSLHLDAVTGDAGFGYDIVLHTIHHDLHALRLVDLPRSSHRIGQNPLALARL